MLYTFSFKLSSPLAWKTPFNKFNVAHKPPVEEHIVVAFLWLRSLFFIVKQRTEITYFIVKVVEGCRPLNYMKKKKQ